METDTEHERRDGSDVETIPTKMEVSEMPLDRALACVEERDGDAHFERTVGRTYLVTR